jgi:hypothetical protein
LPWGDKLTAESIQFFSPIVIWSRPHQREDIQNKVFPAFQDYLEAWLQMVDIAQPTTNPEQISKNQEAHHRYLMWRATKDPGRNMLARLYGEQLCEVSTSHIAHTQDTLCLFHTIVPSEQV